MRDYKDFAVDLALKAGLVMKKNFSLGIHGMHIEWKKDRTPITQTDLFINDLVLNEVRREYSDHGVLAEEGSSHAKGQEYVWVCDPIDGTFPFAHGYPTFTFSLALVRNGQPILGLLFDPILDRLVLAEEGQGAYLNHRQLKLGHYRPTGRPIIAVESGKESHLVRSEILSADCLITTFACITYSAMLVALGQFAGAIWNGKTPWDGAAVQIIIEEAGGVCRDLNGRKQKYDQEINGLLAANRQTYDWLKKIVKNNLFNSEKI